MSKLSLESDYQPAGDQPEAIEALVQGVQQGMSAQTLLGVTGSGKTYTMANVIQAVQRPTLIITHNKTLVAQLYGEFKQFFPRNNVGYFVSYYDYYQPEAYLPASDTYIEKDLSINEKIDELRMQATTQLLMGRRDVVIVASVSCIYGLGNPNDYADSTLFLEEGMIYARQQLLEHLVNALYSRTETDFVRGSFQVKGDTVYINVPYTRHGYCITFDADTIEAIFQINTATMARVSSLKAITLFPANLYVAPKESLQQILLEIDEELQEQLEYFKHLGKHTEADRLQKRVSYDLEMIRELGFCSGIENYSRFFDRRKQGTRPFCLIDYFPEDFLCFIDESHQTIPQIKAMYAGDKNRKLTLVNYGFRIPSALDNRPLSFDEFEKIVPQSICVSATPGDYELEQCGGSVVEQIVRPTGLLDPPIEVRPTRYQIDDLLSEIQKRVMVNERTLVVTLTKRMSEELDKYMRKHGVKSCYLHSSVDTLDRVKILQKLRLGELDVVVGVNLLREGLDLPEVSLIAILDADKEGFLRNYRSLTQTAGRAARHEKGLVIFYADTTTRSMQDTIRETNKRRQKQIVYNKVHHITPKTVQKSKEDIMQQTSALHINNLEDTALEDQIHTAVQDESKVIIDSSKHKQTLAQRTHLLKEKMKKAAKNQDFIEAAHLRDVIKKIDVRK